MENNGNFCKMEYFGLTSEEIKNIRGVFKKYEQITSAIIYGSRAKGNSKPFSDIDLSLKGDNLDLTFQQNLEFDLDDLMLPNKFDISVYDKLTNPEFVDHINRVGHVFYSSAQEL